MRGKENYVLKFRKRHRKTRENHMLNRISVKLSKRLLDKIEVDKREEDVYVYGFELILSTLAGLTSILILTAVFSKLIVGFLFIAIFVPLRIFTGGYHASTYGRCFIISNLSYLTVLMIKNLTWYHTPVIVWYCLLLAACYYILIKAPVINPSQPVSEYRKKRSKKMVKYILGFDIAGAFLLSLISKEWLCMVVLSICLTAVFLIPAEKTASAIGMADE